MDELDEVLDIAQRQKRAQIMRRYAAKIERKRELAQKRLAPEKNIKKRAYAQARQIVRKRFAGARGAEYEKLGPSEKIAIDRAIEKKTSMIKKLALRLIPKIKQAEAKRLQSFTQGQALKNHGQPEGKTVSESLNSLFAESFPPMTNTSTSQLPGENGSNKNNVQTKAKKKAKTGDVIIYNRFGEGIVVSKSVFEGLSKKCEKSGIDIETLGEVYSRGCDAWEEGGKYTQQQYAFARVNSYINEGSSYYELDADLHGEELAEKRGLWDNIHAKRKRIKAGSGERMRKPGSKGAPTAQDFKDAQESVQIDEANKYSVHKGKEGWYVNQHTDNGVWNHSVQTGYHDSKQKAVAWAKKHAAGREHTIDIKEETQIDEISQSTAKSYVSKAFKDSDARAEKMRAQAFGNTTMTDKEHDDAFKKQMNRGRGINLALGKLGHKPMGSVRKTGVKVMAKEESELDENAWNQLGQKKPVGNTLPAPARGTVPKHGRKFSEGDHVVPHTGPHAGEVHRVTSSRASSVNIVHPNGKYDTVTVRAKHEHLSPATPEQTAKYKAAREAEHKRMFGEDIEESNNTPYVRPHIEKGSTKQTGWKASNKHGRVKYFGMDFKKSAEKHAGINEETELDEGIKEKIKGVIRREKAKDMPLIQNRRDYAATKAGEAYEKGDEKKGRRYMDWREKSLKKEEVELDEMGGDQHYSDTKGATSGGAKGTPITTKKMVKDSSKTLNQMFQRAIKKEDFEIEESSDWINNNSKWKEAVKSAHGDDVTFKTKVQPGVSGKKDTHATNSKGTVVGVYQHHNKMGRVYSEETEAVGTKVRKNMEIVDRKPKTPGVYTKQAEVKNKIIDEEGNVENDPKKRLTGTDSLVRAYKKDTPGQGGDLNESFNIAFAAGVGVSLTAADLGMKAQGGFALHPSVIAEMEARELEEDAVSAEKKPVYMPSRRKQDGSYTAAKTVLRKSGRKIIDAQEPEDADSDEHDGK